MSRGQRSSATSYKSTYSEKLSKSHEYKSNSDKHSHLIHIECEADKVRKDIQKEQHEKRIKDLKELLPVIESENWKYRSVDQLLGLTSS